MYTFILSFIIFSVIAFCTKKFFKGSFQIFFVALASSIVTLVVNCGFYAINKNTMPTKDVVVREKIISENLNFELYNDSIIKLTGDGIRNKLLLGENAFVNLSDTNLFIKVETRYDVDNNWVISDAFFEKETYIKLNLNKKNYEIFKSYQDSIKKRKNTLQ